MSPRAMGVYVYDKSEDRRKVLLRLCIEKQSLKRRHLSYLIKYCHHKVIK